MCRGAKGGTRRVGGGRARAARESTFVFPSDASTAAGPLCQHRGPRPCLGSSGAQAAAGGLWGWDRGGGRRRDGVSPNSCPCSSISGSWHQTRAFGRGGGRAGAALCQCPQGGVGSLPPPPPPLGEEGRAPCRGEGRFPAAVSWSLCCCAVSVTSLPASPPGRVVASSSARGRYELLSSP